MSDVAERGVKFLLMAELAPSAKAVIDDFAKKVQSLQGEVNDLTTKLAASSASAVASVASSTASAVKQAEAEVVKSATAMTVAMTESVPIGKLEQLYQMQSAMLEAKQQREEQAYMASLIRMQVARERLDEAYAQKDHNKANPGMFPEVDAELDAAIIAAAEKNLEQVEKAHEKLEAAKEKLAEKSFEKELNNQIKSAEADQKAADKKVESAKKQAEAIQKARDKEIESALASVDRKVEKEIAADDRVIASAKKKADAAQASRDKEVEKALASVDKLVDKEIALAKKKADAEISERERSAEAVIRRSNSLHTKMHSDARQAINNFLELGESTMRFARGLTAIGLIGETELQKVTDGMLKMQAAMDLAMGFGRTIQKIDDGYRQLRLTMVSVAEAQGLINIAQGAMRGASGGGGGSGAGAGVVSGAAGGAAGGLLSKGLIAGAGYATSALGGIGGSLVGGAGGAGSAGTAITAAIGGSLAAVGAAAVAAVGSVVFALTSIVGVANDIKNKGLGGGGAYSEAVGNSYFNPMSYITHPIARQFERDQTSQVKHMGYTEKAIAMNNADQEKIVSAEATILQLKQEAFRVEQSRKSAALEGLTVDEKKIAINREIVNLSAKAKTDESARGELISWQEKRLSVEREIADVKLKSAQEAIKSAEKEIDSIERKRQAIIDARASGQEKFGMLDEDKQQEVREAKARFDRGQADSEDLKLIRGFDRQTDERIKGAFIQNGQQSGFNGIFGAGGDRAEIAQLDKLQNSLQLQVKQQTDFTVVLQADTERFAKQVGAEIAAIRAVHEREVMERLKAQDQAIVDIRAGIQRRNAGG